MSNKTRLAKIKLKSCLGTKNQWSKILAAQFASEHIQKLEDFLSKESLSGKNIYPPTAEIFSAFKHTPYDNTKVVIIGQDPYHGPDQAHGLSFSVKPGVKIPPSLRNIYKELETDLKVPLASHGCLNHWADQGVLLLNSVLTVESSLAASHQKKGWEQFTDGVIEILNEEREKLVFILWGASAQKKGAKIDRKRHLVIESVHPSPLSAHRGFFGTKPFSKTNRYLIKHGVGAIEWQLD